MTWNQLSELMQELVDVCEVYKKIYPIIYNHPNLLYIELLSRLESRSEYVQQFSSSSKIQLLNKSFIKDEAVKDLYRTSSDSSIVNFYSQHDGPLLFIHTRNESNKHSTIHLLDSSNSRLMRSLDLNQEIEDDLQIVIKSGKQSNSNANDVNECCFFYYSQNSVYFQDFVSTKRIFENQNGKVKSLLLLPSNHLAIFMNNSMMLVDIERNESESEKIFEIENNDDEIELVESTIPKQTVFSSGYLERVDGVTIIVGFKLSKIMRIYRFNNKNKAGISLISQLDSIKYDYFGFYNIKR